MSPFDAMFLVGAARGASAMLVLVMLLARIWR